MNTTNITNYKPKDFAELLGVSVKTLQRWDRDDILKSNHTSTEDIILIINIYNLNVYKQKMI